MRYSWLCFLTLMLLACLCLPALAAPQPSFFIHNGDKVVFYGDSITDGEWYPTLVETFVLTRYPTWRNLYFNRGVSGDNTGSIKRFERDVVAQNPQVVTFMMGYNDGGYAKLSSAAIENFLGNLEQSVALTRKVNLNVRFMLMAPTINETVVSDDPRWVSPDVYPYTLLMLGQEEGKLAARLGTSFVDIGTLYGQTLGLGRAVGGTAFALSRDGVHPQQEGQTFIAYHLLRGMNADPLLADVAIDAATGKLQRAVHCKVSGLAVKNGAITFTRTCDALPYPTPAVARPFSFLVHLDDTLNLDRLTVKGLTAPSYVLSVDDQRIAEVPATVLAEGLNLSKYPATSMYQQALAVFDAVREKQQLESAYWRQYIGGNKADGAGLPLSTLDAATRSEVDAARAKIATAITACYALNTPRQHTIKLEPSQTKLAPYDVLVSNDLNQAFVTVTQSPVKVDWNAMTPIDRTFTLTLGNPNTSAKSGTVHWTSGAGWTITPADMPFTIEPGKNISLPFTLACAPGTPLLPLPSVAVRWPWTKDWAYLQTVNRELALQPVLTVKSSTMPVTIDGALDDWADATTFTLDDVHFIDPPVAGKKALWGGPADLSMKTYLKWDEKALYLAAVVRDSEHIQNADPSMMWSQDMLHVSAYLLEPGKTDGHYEFGFGAYADKDSVVKYMNSYAADDTGAQIQFKSHLDQANGTCTYETAIPWDRLKPFIPQAGKSFRFTFAVSDADSQPGKGFNFIEWTPGIDYGKNPFDSATLILGGK